MLFRQAYTAISKTAKNPELAAARFLDYSYTDAGHMLYNFGIEGKATICRTERPVFTGLITKKSRRTFICTGGGTVYKKRNYSGIFEQDRICKAGALHIASSNRTPYDVV